MLEPIFNTNIVNDQIEPPNYTNYYVDLIFLFIHESGEIKSNLAWIPPNT